MVSKIEHYRTPLQTILDLEAQIRGSIAGFLSVSMFSIPLFFSSFLPFHYTERGTIQYNNTPMEIKEK